MGIILFIVAVLFSAGPIYLAYLALSEQLSLPIFTLASTTIAVLFIFIAFHYMNRTYQTKKLLKQEQKQNAKQKQDLEQQLSEYQKVQASAPEVSDTTASSNP